MQQLSSNEKYITAVGEILFDVYPTHKKLGGAPFNFIYHIEKLVGNGRIISRIGNDSDGKEILNYLEEKNINTDFIQIDEKFESGIVKVLLDDNKIPSFEILNNRAYDNIQLNDTIVNLIQNSNLLYVGTLAQRNTISRETIKKTLEMKRKVFCDLNIRQNFYSKQVIEKTLNRSNVVKLNEAELELVTYLLFNVKDEIMASSKRIRNHFDLDLLCVTLGHKGAYLFREDSESYYKVEINKIADTVGAGDAYSAMMCLGYLRDWDLDRINMFASEFAGEICKIHGAIPENDDLYQLYKEKIK